SKLTELTWLSIANNQLQSLPEWIGELSKLGHLDLAHNQLRSLPEGVSKLTELTWLSIANNQLQSLPEWIGELSKLGHLNLAHNQLRSLPEGMSKLTELTWLSIANNQLQNLPEWIGNLTLLTRLDLEENQLRDLPESIGQLIGLSCLDISNNQLRSLPEEMSKLTALTWLSIRDNELQSLPEWIVNLIELTTLNISLNYFEILPTGIENLIKLTVLDASYNQLQNLSPALAQLPRESVIWIVGNRMSQESIQLFQEESARQQEANSALGPMLDLRLPSSGEAAPVSLQEEIFFWQKQFHRHFPVGSAARSAFPEWLLSTMGEEELPTIVLQLLYQQPEEEENRLTEGEISNLMNFLRRLQGTQDYLRKGTRSRITLRVMQMLHGVVIKEAFREKLFSIIGEALTSCGDRVTIYWNMVEIYWQLYCQPKGNTKTKLAKILIGAKRLSLLDGISRQKALDNNLGDEIEAMLYYQIKLGKNLEIPISTEGMNHESMAGVTQEDLEEAEAMVFSLTGSRKQIVEILAPSKKWLEILHSIEFTIAKVWKEKIEETYKKEFLGISERIGTELEKLYEQFERQMQKIEGKRLPKKEETKQMNALVAQRVAKEKLLVLQKTAKETDLCLRKTKEWVQRHY
ncbi:MAG: leucine-rich repeat domain-containing protein, partial [Simkania sp.]|nr:leucine-rich repeat domain-containing protein [Simkania sp.]